jgi:hypothetical protein
VLIVDPRRETRQADPQPIPRVENRLINAFAVDEGAVARTQITDHNHLVCPLDAAVPATDPSVRHGDLDVAGAANGGRQLSHI